MNRNKSRELGRTSGNFHRVAKYKKNTQAQLPKGRSVKPSYNSIKKKQSKQSNIQDAIKEALEDYSTEHVDEYSFYEPKPSPSTSSVDYSSPDATSESSDDDTKRRHSFDLEVSRSPVLSSRASKDIPFLDLGKPQQSPVTVKQLSGLNLFVCLS